MGVSHDVPHMGHLDEGNVMADEQEQKEQGTPVPPPVNVGVGSQKWEGKAGDPNERKSIAEDPEGKENAKSSGKSKK